MRTFNVILCTIGMVAAAAARNWVAAIWALVALLHVLRNED